VRVITRTVQRVVWPLAQRGAAPHPPPGTCVRAWGPAEPSGPQAPGWLPAASAEGIEGVRPARLRQAGSM